MVIIALIGWSISRPHATGAASIYLHWASAVLAAYLLGAAAWSIISKPSRLLLALGYLVLGAAMSLRFTSDLMPADRASNLAGFVPIIGSAGLLLLFSDHQKNEAP